MKNKAQYWHVIGFLLVSLQGQTDRQIILSAVLQGSDYITTVYAIQDGYVEMNPMMQPIVHKPAIFAIVKFIVFYGSSKLSQKQLKWLNRYYILIVVNNLYQIKTGANS